MPQERFACAIRVTVATLRDREENRLAMDPGTIALMMVLAREPDAALPPPG